MSLPDGGNFSSIVVKDNKENTDNDQQEQSRGEIIGIEHNVEGGMSDDLPRTQSTKGVFIDLSSRISLDIKSNICVTYALLHRKLLFQIMNIL